MESPNVKSSPDQSLKVIDVEEREDLPAESIHNLSEIPKANVENVTKVNDDNLNEPQLFFPTENLNLKEEKYFSQSSPDQSLEIKTIEEKDLPTESVNNLSEMSKENVEKSTIANDHNDNLNEQCVPNESENFNEEKSFAQEKENLDVLGSKNCDETLSNENSEVLLSALDSETNEDSNEDCSNDSMPDLIWPEKKLISTTEAKSKLTTSDSHDTGFGSEDISPDETLSKLDSLDKGSSLMSDNNTDAQNEEGAKDDDYLVMDILGNGLLIKKILLPGKGIETRPSNGDIVTLRVEGRLEDGTLVETGDITFSLNDGDVILAFDLAAALMEEGEKCELTTDAKYAYGQIGREPDIPKDSKLVYVLELINIQPAPELSSLTFEERLRIGEFKRERGNYLFGRTDFTGAINSYTKAVKVLEDAELNGGLDRASHSLLVDSSVKCYNNMAACQLKIDAFDAVIRSCEKVLAVQNENVKALYRIGKAYGAKGEIELAIDFMRRAIKLDPGSKMLNQEMLNLTRRKSKETASERELYQKMLGVKPNENQTQKKKAKNSGSFIKWTLITGAVAALVSIGVAFLRSSAS